VKAAATNLIAAIARLPTIAATIAVVDSKPMTPSRSHVSLIDTATIVSYILHRRGISLRCRINSAKESVGKITKCLSRCILSGLCVSVVNGFVGNPPQRHRVHRDRTKVIGYSDRLLAFAYFVEQRLTLQRSLGAALLESNGPCYVRLCRRSAPAEDFLGKAVGRLCTKVETELREDFQWWMPSQPAVAGDSIKPGVEPQRTPGPRTKRQPSPRSGR